MIKVSISLLCIKTLKHVGESPCLIEGKVYKIVRHETYSGGFTVINEHNRQHIWPANSQISEYFAV